MQQQRAVWLVVSADRNDTVVRVNDIPAARLRGSSGRRLPIEEYLLRGRNTVEVRMDPFFDPAGPERPRDGIVRLAVEELTFRDEALSDRRVLVEVAAPYPGAAVVPGGVLVSAPFDADRTGAPDLAGFAPVGAAERTMIVQQLARAAEWWRRGDVPALSAWLERYMGDFTAAYPQDETLEEYRAGFEDMIRSYAGGGVDFDPAAVMLEPCGEGRLVDARSASGGAAIHVTDATGEDDYAFWTVLGVRNGKVEMVR